MPNAAPFISGVKLAAFQPKNNIHGGDRMVEFCCNFWYHKFCSLTYDFKLDSPSVFGCKSRNIEHDDQVGLHRFLYLNEIQIPSWISRVCSHDLYLMLTQA